MTVVLCAVVIGLAALSVRLWRQTSGGAGMRPALAIGCVFSVVVIVLASVGVVHLLLAFFGWVAR